MLEGVVVLLLYDVYDHGAGEALELFRTGVRDHGNALGGCAPVHEGCR